MIKIQTAFIAIIIIIVSVVVLILGITDIIYHLGIAKHFIIDTPWNSKTDWIIADSLLIIVSLGNIIPIYKKMP